MTRTLEENNAGWEKTQHKGRDNSVEYEYTHPSYGFVNKYSDGWFHHDRTGRATHYHPFSSEREAMNHAKKHSVTSESHVVRFPTLRKMVETTYVDPRQEGKKIYFQKEGTFLGKDDRVMRGTYVCYHESEMPSKCVTVFIDEEIREGMAEDYNPVNLISITNDRKQAMSRVSYRNRIAERFNSEKREDLAHYQDPHDMEESLEEYGAKHSRRSAGFRKHFYNEPEAAKKKRLPGKAVRRESAEPAGVWSRAKDVPEGCSHGYHHPELGEIYNSEDGGWFHMKHGKQTHEKAFPNADAARKYASEGLKESFGDSALKSASDRDEEAWKKNKSSYEEKAAEFKKPPKKPYPTVKTESAWSKNLDPRGKRRVHRHPELGSVFSDDSGRSWYHNDKKGNSTHSAPFKSYDAAVNHASKHGPVADDDDDLSPWQVKSLMNL